MKKDRKRVLFRRLLSPDGQTELLRFDFVSEHDGWYHYSISFTSVSEEQLDRIFSADADPRDVPYTFELTDGSRYAFANAFAIYDKKRGEFRAKGGMDNYPTSPADWYYPLLSVFGVPRPKVQQERAPLTWARCNKAKILSLSSSRDAGKIEMGLSEAAYSAHRRDIPWVVDLLLEGAKHENTGVKAAAFYGFGEIARVHGYSDKRALQILNDQSRSNDPDVQCSAKMALAEISRFANG